MTVVVGGMTSSAMARICAIATVVLVLLAGCKSSSAVVADRAIERMSRSVDTLLTVPGGEARMRASLAVADGKIVLRGVESTGEGVSMKARIEQEDDRYSLVVDAEVAERQVPVQLHEEREIIAEHLDEDKMHDSRAIPVWIVGVVVLVVLILIYIVKRWTK